MGLEDFLGGVVGGAVGLGIGLAASANPVVIGALAIAGTAGGYELSHKYTPPSYK